MKTSKIPKEKIIVTKAFTLRPIRQGDGPALTRLINDKTIARNLLTVPYPYTNKDTQEWLAKVRGNRRKKAPTWINFAIEIDGDFAGDISISKITEFKAEIGYWLGRPYWGKGIMTSVVKEISKFAFQEIGLTRLYAYVFTYNKGSRRVLEKAGFKYEGLLKKNVRKGEKLIDEYLFAKIKRC